jgi:hypothetical protein
MYIGALIWVISVGAAILQIILSFLGVGRIFKKSWQEDGRTIERRSSERKNSFSPTAYDKIFSKLA